MSTSRESIPDEGSPLGTELECAGANHQSFNGGGQTDAQQTFRGGGDRGSSRQKRRRQRSQHGKFRPPSRGGAPQLDVVSRERVFQDLEGLLRQIREQAEESTDWAEDRLNEITQTVTSFTKSLEEQGDPISERSRSEYQRIREKLSQALRG